MFVISSICFIIFLFCIYLLAKDDFIFIRKGIALESVFNTIFLALPIALLVARIVFILLHPSRQYLNPLVFLALPYFPGLSLIGGILGTWIFVFFYTKKNKIPYGRILDMLGVAFILSFSIGILLSGIIALFHNRLVGIEQIGESMLGLAFFVFLLTEFLRGSFVEGIESYLAVLCYCLLSYLSVGFMVLSHGHIVISSFILTSILFLVSFILFFLRLFSSGNLRKK